MPMKKDKVTKVVLLIVAVILIVCIGVLAVMRTSGKLKQTLETWKQSNDGTKAITNTEVGDKEGVKNGTDHNVANTGSIEAMQVLENLEQEVAIANAQDLHGFTAFVEQINGKQYLTFSNGIYKISYKNAVAQSAEDSV